MLLVEHQARVFPSWDRRGGRAIRKCREASFEGAAGVVSSAKQFVRATTPSAPLRKGSFFLLAQPPLLFQEGNTLASRSSLTRRKKCYTKAPGFVPWCLMRPASIGRI